MPRAASVQNGFLAARNVSERRYMNGLRLLCGELEGLIEASFYIPEAKCITLAGTSRASTMPIQARAEPLGLDFLYCWPGLASG